MGGDGSGGIGQVAGGGAAHGGEAELPGPGEGHRHHAILKGERRHVDAVVLDVEVVEAQPFGQIAGLEQGGESCAHIDGISLDGQKIAVAPNRGGASLDRGPAHLVADRLVVVDDFEGAKAHVFAHVTGSGPVGVPAFLAAQTRKGGAGEGCCHDQTQRSNEANSAVWRFP